MSDGPKGVEVGKSWIVKDGNGLPRAVIETIELTRRFFSDIDEAFAYDEGEGDRTLQYWRNVHTKYFTRLGVFSEQMELYCERFKLVEALRIMESPTAPR